MGFSTFIRRLLPKENQYFALFTANVGNIHSGAEDLRKLLAENSSSERKLLLKKIEEAEHRGDAITHDIFTDLSQSFITPIDREDI